MHRRKVVKVALRSPVKDLYHFKICISIGLGVYSSLFDASGFGFRHLADKDPGGLLMHRAVTGVWSS